MAKEPTPPKSFTERDNPLLALLGNKSEEERIAQQQTDQVVGSVDDAISQLIANIEVMVSSIGETIKKTGEMIAKKLSQTKEERQEEIRRQNAIWDNVFDFFGNAFKDLKEFFRVKKEWSWWDLIKEAAFWITAVGLAYFWRLYKVVDVVIRGIKNLYNLIKDGKLVKAVLDYFKAISTSLKGWMANLFRTIREGVYARIANLFSRMWNLIKESKFFRVLKALGSDIARGLNFLFGKIRPVINLVVREFGLLLKDIKILVATLRSSKIVTAITNFFTRLGNAFNTAKAFVIGTTSKLVSSLSSIFSRLSGVFVKVYSTVSSFFQTVSVRFASLFKSVTPIVSRIAKVFSGIASRISKIINLIAPATFAEVSAIFSSIVSKISTVVSFLKPAIDMIGGLFKSGGGLSQIFSIFSRVSSTLMRVGSSVFNVVKSVGNFIVRFVPFVGRLIKWVPILGWVITAIDGIIGAVKGFFASEGKGILERIGMVFQGVIAGIVSGLSLGFLEFNQIMGWFDTATTWLGDVFYKIYEFFTDTLPSFFTETIPNFFTVTIPNFFAWLGSTIWEGIKSAAQMAWDAITYPFIMISDFFSNLVKDLQIMFAKIDLWIAEALNIFGADEDDPAVVAAKKKLDMLEGKGERKLTPLQQDAAREKQRLKDIQVRENNLTQLDKETREEERKAMREMMSRVGGNTTMNVVTTTNAATTAVSTGKQPATESDPSLRRAAGNVPYYGAGI